MVAYGCKQSTHVAYTSFPFTACVTLHRQKRSCCIPECTSAAQPTVSPRELTWHLARCSAATCSRLLQHTQHVIEWKNMGCTVMGSSLPMPASSGMGRSAAASHCFHDGTSATQQVSAQNHCVQHRCICRATAAAPLIVPLQHIRLCSSGIRYSGAPRHQQGGSC